MRYVFDVVLLFISLGVTEAIVKPIAKKFVQRRTIAAATAILPELDRRLPELLTLPDAGSVESYVRDLAEQVTGEDWSRKSLEPLFKWHDLRRAVGRHNG